MIEVKVRRRCLKSTITVAHPEQDGRVRRDEFAKGEMEGDRLVRGFRMKRRQLTRVGEPPKAVRERMDSSLQLLRFDEDACDGLIKPSYD